MNIKTYEAQVFAYQHYLKILKCKPAIDSSPPKQQRVSYTSRNLTHMAQYEEDLKKNKLVKKLVEIHDANYKQNYFKPTKSLKRKVSKKNRQLTFSDNKTYHSLNKTLVNPFKAKQKQTDITENNCELIDRLSLTKSDYKKAFGKERQKKLKNYSKILVKSKQDQEIRNNFFSLYRQLKLVQADIHSKGRPYSSRPKSRKSSNFEKIFTQETTRPQTARLP